MELWPIYGNNVTNSVVAGIHLYNASNNVISENIITNNTRGMWLERSPMTQTNYNTIYRNNITSNQQGIYLDSSSGNYIYHNNFISNLQQVFTINSVNAWDYGYPSCGNYWSNYAGLDLYEGSYQNILGSDGIGDTPYVIDTNNRDRYPLVNPIEATCTLELRITYKTSDTFYATTYPTPGLYVCPASIVVVVNADPNLLRYWILDGSFLDGINPITVTMDTIHKLCAHLGWSLSKGMPSGGTINVLLY